MSPTLPPSVTRRRYGGGVLDPNRLDLAELADALSNQSAAGGDYQWLLHSETGELAVWSESGGINEKIPAEFEELDDLGYVVIEPLSSLVWYGDMHDFAGGLSDDETSERLAEAMRGRGGFRRFGDALYQQYPELIAVWEKFREARARRHVVEWLEERKLISEEHLERFWDGYRDPDLP
jgi:hypothetical protein